MTMHDEVGFSTGIYVVRRRSKVEYDNDGYLTRPALLDHDATTIDSITDEITIVDHGATTGVGPVWVTTDDTLPVPLDDRMYWIIRVDDDTIRLATSAANALANVSVDLIDEGLGSLHVASHFLMNADIQAEGGRTLDDAPEAQVTAETRTCFTSVKLYTREPGFEPDVVLIDGEEWRVDKVEHFPVISGHYRAKLVRMDPP